jgi:hypothetical protein
MDVGHFGGHRIDVFDALLQHVACAEDGAMVLHGCDMAIEVQTALDKFSVPATEQDKVKALVESTRAAIVVPAA